MLSLSQSIVRRGLHENIRTQSLGYRRNRHDVRHVPAPRPPDCTWRSHGSAIRSDKCALAVMGSIVLSESDVTVPQIARNLGLSRQAVQRVANDLNTADLIIFDDNPHHKRAKLIRLT
jgi:hypothetical protein